jgi:hypothetical protein
VSIGVVAGSVESLGVPLSRDYETAEVALTGGPTIDWLDVSTGAGLHNITLGKGIFCTRARVAIEDHGGLAVHKRSQFAGGAKTRGCNIERGGASSCDIERGGKWERSNYTGGTS